MYLLTDLCFLCLGRTKDIKSVSSQADDGIVIEEKLKCVLIELVNFRQEIPKNVCLECLKGLNYVYRFKQKCLENLLSLSDYLEKIAENMALEHFLSTFNEAQYDKEQQATPENQTVAKEECNITKNDEPSLSDPKKFICDICHKQFTQKSHLKDHLLIHTRSVSLNRHGETNTDNIEEDKATTHSNPESQTQENEIKVIIKIDPGDIHDNDDIQGDSEEMVVECEPKDALQNDDIHNAATSTASERKTRNRPTKSKDKRRHNCPDCNKPFLSPSHLAIHRRVHTGERPFECPTCQKTFKRPEHLKNHLRIHTGEKSYSCDVCHKAFNQHTNLITHKRLHSDVRPYKCSVCDKTFTVNNHLAVHMLSHTGEKPYHCNLCEYKCTTNRDLKLHSRTHTREKPYSCKHCLQAFTTSSNLQRHIRVNKH